MKTYAVLHAPEFRLQALLRHRAEGARGGDGPAALLELAGKKPFVAELNATARAGGVERGMTPTQAQARCPGLQLLSADAGHERSAQEILRQSAETLSPFLESTRPGVVTVELPPERAFSVRELEEKIVRALARLGLETGLGVAATPDLALLAARRARPVEIVAEPAAFLAPLPIAWLGPSAELAAILSSWGIRTVGDLVALPARAAAERLGPEGVTLREQARGGRPRPLRLAKPVADYVERADLEHPVEMLEPLLFLLRRFLGQLVARLENVYLVAGRLRLTLRFENDPPYARTFTIPQPTRQVELLFRMLHTHLENFTADSPIVGLELAADPVRPQAEQFGLLEPGLRDPHQFAETLARMEALLGPGDLGAPVIEPSHCPEAFQLRAYDFNAPLLPREEFLVGLPWLRFRPAVPARVFFHDARPVHLDSPAYTGPIQDARGPWHLAGDWWDARPWSREEWDAATEAGIYRLVHDGRDWFLDGIYG